MAKKYRIVSGSFRVSEKKVLGVGDEIELDDDVAKANAHMIEPVEPVQVDAPHEVPSGDEQSA